MRFFFPDVWNISSWHSSLSSNVYKSLVLKNWYLSRHCKFYKKRLVLCRGVWQKQKCVWTPVGAGVFRRKDRWGPVTLWAHCMGFSKASVSHTALLSLKTQGKKKTISSERSLQDLLKHVIQNTTYLVPSSKTVNTFLSFFLLFCEFNLPS